ncbi:HAUS augmin-like complex subunit 6 N-terminus domain-containing protein, partial [Trichoderma austrokoningii]
MLDECKGERLEEVLAFFSTAVLKKVVSDSLATSRGYASPAVELAFENKGYKTEKSHLIALSMAHKASIRQVLRRKEAAKARFKDLAHVLDDKEDDIIRRRETLQIKEMDGGGGQTVSANARAEMRRAVHHNWASSEAWMEALLSGDPKHGGLLATGFDRVWRRAQKGRLNDLDTEDVGLLEQLDNRVKLQKERLHRWDAFRRNTFGEAAPAPSKPRASSSTKTKGIDLGFSAHLDLQTVRRVKPARAALFQHAPQMTDDYAALVSDLQYELGKIATKEVNTASLTRKRTPVKQDRRDRRLLSTSSFEGGDDDEISDLEDAESVFRTDGSVTSFSSFQDKLDKFAVPSRTVRPVISRPSLSQLSGPETPVLKKWPSQRNFPGRSTYDLTQIEDSPLATPPSPTKKATTGYDTPTRRRSPPERTKSMPGQQKVPHNTPQQPSSKAPEDDGLDAIKDKTPAPMKRTKPRHTLSLAERTRLSMSRKKSMLFEDEELDPPTPVAAATKTTDMKAPEPDYSEDLASRTRRSLAGFEQAQQKAQMERRRSLRRSKMPQRKEGGYFPTVEEDLNEATLLLEQLAEEADVEAVFRSRPKVGQSLQPSPTREEWGDIPEHNGVRM